MSEQATIAKRCIANMLSAIEQVEDELARLDAFAGDGDLSAMPATTITRSRLEAGLGLLEILEEAELTGSRGEGRRMIQQGGVYVNDNRIDEVTATLTPADLTPEGILLRVGKKKYHRLVVDK